MNPDDLDIGYRECMAVFSGLRQLTTDLRESPTWVYDRNRWLCDHFGTTLGKKVVYTSHKELVKGDLIIEDRPENITAWRAAQSGLTVLMERPHNRSWQGYTDFRVAHWDQAVDVVDALQGTRATWERKRA